MIIPPFKSRFETLKANGDNIQFVIDIGAYRGHFTETIHAVWPLAIVKQIEADERQLQFLQKNAIIALLGDKESDNVPYYTLSSDSITTGSSIFKEQSPYYTSNSTIVMQKPMTTLDNLDKIHKFVGNWKTHGLLKIDTQGSEMLILEGAKEFLLNKQPKFILLECSVVEYNKGAPSMLEMINYMNRLGYSIYDIFDLSYDSRGNLLQTDILFKRM